MSLLLLLRLKLKSALSVFARPSVANKQDGSQATSGEVRYETALCDQGIMIEEGATNLPVNPFFGGAYVGGTAPNWIIYNAPTLAENTDTDYITYGAKSQHVTTDALFEGVYQSFAILNSTLYTAKCRIYVVSGTVRFDCYFGGTYYYVDSTGTGWKELTVGPYTTDGVGGVMYLYSVIEATEFYIDAVQFEQKSFATSFIDGTRSAETVTIPNTDVFTKGDATIEVAFKPTSTQVVTGKTGYLWENYIDATNYYRLLIHATGRPYFVACSGGTEYSTYNASDSVLAVGTNYRVWAKLNGSTICSGVNGTKGTAGDVAYVEPVGDLPANSYLGSDHNGANHANGIYDEYFISDTRTDADLTGRGANTNPLQLDKYVTWSQRFNGDLVARQRVY